MANKSKRWKYQDPSWPQIVWLYLGVAIFAVPDTTPLRLAFGAGLAVFTTALLVIKIVRERNAKPETDTLGS